MPVEFLAVIVILVVAAATLLSRRLGVADPIVLVVAGALLGLVPGLPEVPVEPDLLLFVVLPPLLFWHAFIITPREVRANAAAIGMTSIALVAATAVVVGLVAHVVAGLPWAVAIVFGAIVAPTDAVAFLTVARRYAVSPRLVGLLDGENLLNDFTALVIYVVALEAVDTGAFSAPEATLQLVLTAGVGVVIGYIVGRGISWVNSKMTDPIMAPTITLCGAYLAFLPAEGLHVSAILAAGVAGRVAGRRSPMVDRPGSRLTGYGFWNTWIYLLTAVLFILVGLQLPVILEGLKSEPSAGVVLAAAAVTATVIVFRLLWMLAMVYLLPRVSRSFRTDGRRPWPEGVVAGWSGMRGALTLVMALALPATFPDRPLVLFGAYAVLMVTLVGQGLTLPFFIKRLPIEASDAGETEMARLREAGRQAALDRLASLEIGDAVGKAEAARLREEYLTRSPSACAVDELRRVRSDMIAAERMTAIDLREQGAIGDETLREYEQELDMRSLINDPDV